MKETDVTSYGSLYLNFVADLKYKLSSLRWPIWPPMVPYSPQPTVLNYKTERLRVYSEKYKQARKKASKPPLLLNLASY